MIIDAWLIHKIWSGETSARITLFTRERGIVQALYKGGRSPKNQALLQAFTPLWVVIDEKNHGSYIRKLETRAAHLALFEKYLLAGLYVNELLYLAQCQNDPVESLYIQYEKTLLGLSSAPEKIFLESLLRRFEWHLLCVMGYPMSLTQDARSLRLIESSCFYVWVSDRGFIQAERGFLGAHLLAFAADELDDPAVLLSVKQIMRQALSHALGGRSLLTRDLYFKGVE